jgi:uncharacterized protein YjbJ (UPF0337 family)
MTNRNKAKNAAQVAKGHVEESAGIVSGDDRLEKDGQVDEMKGKLKQSSEKLKDAVKE